MAKIGRPRKVPKTTPGPEAERVKIVGNWQKAMRAALDKPPLPKASGRKPKN